MLKTLSEIRSMSTQEIHSYATFLCDNHGWLRQDVTTLLFAAQQAPEEALPVPDALLLHLCKFLIDNYWDEDAVGTQIDDVIETRVFCSAAIATYRWMIDGHSHIVFINRNDTDFLVDFTERLAENDNISDLYVSRFGTSVCIPPQLNTLRTSLVEYMRRLGIVRTPEYLKPNSESLEVKENTARFSGAMWYEAIQQKIITLAGVGGIGGFGNLEKFL